MFGLSTLATQAIMAAVIAGFAFTGGCVITAKVEKGKYETLVAAQATAQAKAEADAAAHQRTFDNIALTAAQKERDDQAQRATQAETLLLDVGNHVSVSVIAPACVPLGFVRVLDAAASGRNSSALSLPTGKSDGSCASIGWDVVARSIVGNYATSRANAGQLNGLIDFYRQTQKAR